MNPEGRRSALPPAHCKLASHLGTCTSCWLLPAAPGAAAAGVHGRTAGVRRARAFRAPALGACAATAPASRAREEGAAGEQGPHTTHARMQLCCFSCGGAAAPVPCAAAGASARGAAPTRVGRGARCCCLLSGSRWSLCDGPAIRKPSPRGPAARFVTRADQRTGERKYESIHVSLSVCAQGSAHPNLSERAAPVTW